MGLFSKIKAGLQKTKNSLSDSVTSLINSFTKIDEEFFEELEETLILADMGVETSGEAVEQLRTRVGAFVEMLSE